jgi:polyisoprenoid-binding protein YceI
MSSGIRNILMLGSVLLLAVGCASAQVLAPAPIQQPADRVAMVAPTSTVSAAPSLSTAAPTSTSSPIPSPAGAPAATAAPSDNTGSSAGTIRIQIVPGKSQAQYRVREQLARLSLPSDAIGHTLQISGVISGKTDGTIVSSESKFTVNLQSLQSDQAMRDNFLRRNVLETDQYPNAVFVPTLATGLIFPLPSSGQETFKLTGDLTIRNVTKPVTWDVTCQGQANQGTCHATTSFNFEYFNLTQPHVGPVLSIVDNITLELDLDLQQMAS